MTKTEQNQAGFSAVEIIIVVVVLALVGLAGWMIHKNHHKPASTVTATDTSSPAAASTTNPYTGWKSYCDTISNGCFKYPSNWSLTSSGANGLVSVQISSPGQTATGTYQSFIAGIGTPPQSGAGFYAASTNNLPAATPSLKIVGGYFTSSNIASYYLVNASALSTYPLTAGQPSPFEAIPDYSLQNSANFGSFFVHDNQNGSAAQAQAWYSTSDAANALLIVQSFYYQ